jgi:GTP-binding protein
MKFIDEAYIYVKAGNGGRGCASFRREKFVPKGGPDGGDGGRGGDVVITGNNDLASLLDFRYTRIYKAENGKNGGSKNKTGRTGKDVCIQVPLGTVVLDGDSPMMLCDITAAAETHVVAQGGRGGRGNARFMTPTHRAPTEFDPGEAGEERNLHLVLKLLAQVGIVGLPNAGKSTLITHLTDARPKIADYPFTTLSPTLGVFENGDERFVIADIPGIVEGASRGKGLGLTFLKHIERTETILVVIDVSSKNPGGDYETLIEELDSYKKEMLMKKRLLVLNKIDLVTDGEVNRWVKFFRKRGETAVAVSALNGFGTDILRGRVSSLAMKGCGDDVA